MADSAAISVNLRELRDLAMAVKAADPELAKSLRAELKKAGNVVASQARMNAPTKTIPNTIKVRTYGFNVSVVAGGGNTPAAAFEHGGVPGSFRHPLFGNRDHWYSQAAQPFLFPAFEARQPQLVSGIIGALDLVFENLGFH